MKTKLLVFLISKAGGIITPIVAILVASVVARLAMFDPKLAETVDQTSLVGFIVALILSAVNYFTNDASATGIKRIQALVNTDEDGVAGPITYTEVRRAIEVPKAKKPACSRKKKR